MAENKLKKHQHAVFLDVSKTINGAGEWSPSWKRSRYSTILALNLNPQTETNDYIAFESPIEEVTKNQPEIPLENVAYEGDPLFDFLYKLYKSRPVGTDVNVPALVCFGGTDKDAWQSKQATIIFGEFNAVDAKISYTIKLGGDVEDGTYAITAGAPTFTPKTGS